MHPILGQFRRLVLYLSAWGPVSGILLYIFVSQGGLNLTRAAALVFPLCIIYAFVCLSAWYTCRSTPFDNSGSWLGHLVAAVVASLLWVGMAKGLASGLAQFPRLAGLDQKLGREVPILLWRGMKLYSLA